MKLLLLILAIVLFAVAAILAFVDPTFSVLKVIGITDVGLALFDASFLPIP